MAGAAGLADRAESGTEGLEAGIGRGRRSLGRRLERGGFRLEVGEVFPDRRERVPAFAPWREVARDLGSVGGSSATVGLNKWVFDTKFTDSLVRVGLNYKFGGGPVVARY